MLPQKKKILLVSNKKRVATWEAKNADLAFHVRKLYELFCNDDLEKLHQLINKYPVPSNKLASTLAFLSEINITAEWMLSPEKLVKLKALLSETKKPVQKQIVTKKTTFCLPILPVKEREERLGMAVLPCLEARYAQLFVSLLTKHVGPDVWWAFWQQALPDIQVVAHKTLQEPHEEKRGVVDQQKAKKVFLQTKPSVLEALSVLVQGTNVPGYMTIILALGRSVALALEQSKAKF